MRMPCTVIVAAVALPMAVSATVAAPVVPGYERFGRSAADPAARAEAGLLLFDELGCANCHSTAGPAAAHGLPKSGPVLDNAGRRLDPAWISAYLAAPRDAHPGTTMPDLLGGLPADRRNRTVLALTHYLAASGPFVAVGGPGAEQGKPDAGRAIYERSGCAACHGSRVAGAAALPDHRPLGDLAKKWSPEALDEFLKDPSGVRPSGRMPGVPLSDEERRHVVAALVGPAPAAKGAYADVVAFTGRAWRKRVERLPDLASLGEPAQAGPVKGLDVFTLAGVRDDLVVELRGFFHAPRPGRYTFVLGSDDGSRLVVGDATVVDHDGLHSHSQRSGTVDLAAGVHPVRLEYFECQSMESLTLEVIPPGGTRISALAYVTPAADGRPAVTADDARAVAAGFTLDAALVAEGRAAFGTVGCANCHRLDDAGRKEVAATARTLAELSRTDAGCLAGQPDGTAPRYALDDAQRASLAAAVAWLRSPAAATPPDRSRTLDRRLGALNCYACHERDGKGGVLPAVAAVDEDGEPIRVDAARDALFQATQAELGDEGRRPPTLTGVGGKLRPEFVREVMLDGGRDRTATMPTRMPRWAPGVAEPLASELAADQPVACPIPALPGHEDLEIVEQGRQLVGTKALGCIKCHSFGGAKGQSLGLIDMTRMPKRLRHEWFLAYTADPQRFRPGTRMPAAWPEGKTFYPGVADGTAAGQIEAVWRYLAAPNPRPPIGSGANMIELVPTDRPIIYRNFISNAGPRAVGVGYPEGVHLAWDAEIFRVALVWRGAFIDAGLHWTGRGAGWQAPLGDAVFTPDAATAIEVLPDATAAWPKEPPRDRGARFLGYTLDAAGRPTFGWSLAGTTIRETPEPVVAGKARSLRRTIRLSGPPAQGQAVFRAAAGRIEEQGDGWHRVDGTWRVRVTGGVGPTVRREADGRTELRVPVAFGPDGTAVIVEELAW